MMVLCNESGIEKASEIIHGGGVVVFPTDTVYGIGCDPYNHEAVKRIYKIKGREKAKLLPILGYSIKEIQKIARFDDRSSRLAEKFWPGPLTLVLRTNDETIANSLELDEKIAVRIPNHPCTLGLLEKARLLVGTSANFSGQPSFNDSKELQAQFSGFDLLLDGGKISESIESTIVDATGSELRILREGKIRKELLT